VAAGVVTDLVLTGFAEWRGYRSENVFVPFDGKTLVHSILQVGITLIQDGTNSLFQKGGLIERRRYDTDFRQRHNP
jgi:hypothetical protein